MAGRFPPPGLPWRSGVPAAENQALGNRNAPISPAFASVSSPPGPPDPRRPGNGRIPPDLRPWQWRGKLSAEQAHSRDAIRHLCDPSRPRADYGPTAQNNIKLLGFPKGRAPLVAFRPFWPVKMDPSGASPPGWQACVWNHRRTRLCPAVWSGNGKGETFHKTTERPTTHGIQ